MTKERVASEAIYIRAPEGTRMRIEGVRGSELQSEFLRKLLLNALADEESVRKELEEEEAARVAEIEETKPPAPIERSRSKKRAGTVAEAKARARRGKGRAA